MANVFVISMPRSGSSMLANLIASAGYKNFISADSVLMPGSPLNPGGYFEDVKLTLINDQLLKAIYGYETSFLYPPSLSEREKHLGSSVDLIDDKFYYDVDESNVKIPDDYLSRSKDYCGQDWDVWGITRMVNGAKWHRCYSKFGISTKNGLVKAMRTLEDQINNTDGLLIKDPRLSLTLEKFKFSDNMNNKFVHLVRGDDAVVASMKNHYGPAIFTKNLVVDGMYVSNHFNHRVKEMSWPDYKLRYNYVSRFFNEENTIEVSYEKILAKNKQELSRLNQFIGAKINVDLIL